MNKKLATILLSVLLFAFSQSSVFAIENPLDTSNNKFGIHLIDENDIDKAADLVNSSGGDWGYVTIVIREDEMNVDRWQRAFDRMRRDHLIPIVRIASKQNPDGYWEKLSDENINSWVYFLNSLNWVVKNRYVVIGNETNHAKEWGNEINPEEYTKYLKTISSKLKDASDDFFVIQGGFDASAPNDKQHMDEEKYVRMMVDTEPDIFEYLDGWSSHSYPNPGFSGSPKDNGRGTIRTYQWELNLIKSLGGREDIPIFITETGWSHEGDNSIEEITDYYKTAFTEVWNDPNIVAITPFVINHQGKPFDMFSWIRPNGETYPFYDEVKRTAKKLGDPVQIVSGIMNGTITPEITSLASFNSTLKNLTPTIGLGIAENTGQSIWEKGKPVYIKKGIKEIVIEPYFDGQKIEPNKKGLVYYTSRYSLASAGEEEVRTDFLNPLQIAMEYLNTYSF